MCYNVKGDIETEVLRVAFKHNQRFWNQFWNIDPEKQSRSEEIYATKDASHIEDYLDRE